MTTSTTECNPRLNAQRPPLVGRVAAGNTHPTNKSAVDARPAGHSFPIGRASYATFGTCCAAAPQRSSRRSMRSRSQMARVPERERGVHTCDSNIGCTWPCSRGLSRVPRQRASSGDGGPPRWSIHSRRDGGPPRRSSAATAAAFVVAGSGALGDLGDFGEPVLGGAAERLRSHCRLPGARRSRLRLDKV